jgi:hypothetical protein
LTIKNLCRRAAVKIIRSSEGKAGECSMKSLSCEKEITTTVCHIAYKMGKNTNLSKKC